MKHFGKLTVCHLLKYILKKCPVLECKPEATHTICMQICTLCQSKYETLASGIYCAMISDSFSTAKEATLVLHLRSQYTMWGSIMHADRLCPTLSVYFAIFKKSGETSNAAKCSRWSHDWNMFLGIYCSEWDCVAGTILVPCIVQNADDVLSQPSAFWCPW